MASRETVILKREHNANLGSIEIDGINWHEIGDFGRYVNFIVKGPNHGRKYSNEISPDCAREIAKAFLYAADIAERA